MRRFHLVRHEDVSGVSGTGIVAEGIWFEDGKTVLRWLSNGKCGSLSVFDCLDDMITIHGHEGRTVVEYID